MKILSRPRAAYASLTQALGAASGLAVLILTLGFAAPGAHAAAQLCGAEDIPAGYICVGSATGRMVPRLLLTNDLVLGGIVGTSVSQPLSVTQGASPVLTVQLSQPLSKDAVTGALDVNYAGSGTANGALPVANGGTGQTAAGATAANAIGALAKASNLSDLASASAARTSLGLGAAAVIGTPVSVANGGTGQGSAGATAANAIGALAEASNLSDLASASTARANLGIGPLASYVGVLTPPQGRLSIQSNIAIPTVDVAPSAGMSLYWVPVNGGSMPMSGSTGWTYLQVSTQLSTALNTGKVLAGTVNDVFAVLSGGLPQLCVVPWTNTTTPATAITGRGGVALTTGLPVNNASITHCWGGAFGLTDFGTVNFQAATYLGTLYDPVGTNGATAIQLHTSAGVSGTGLCICLYNAFNQVDLTAMELQSGSWTYATLTWRLWTGFGSLDYVTVMDGMGTLSVDGVVYTYTTASTTSTTCRIGIGVASSATAATPDAFGQNSSGASLTNIVAEGFAPNLGAFFYMAEEDATSTCTMPGGAGFNVLKVRARL